MARPIPTTPEGDAILCCGIPGQLCAAETAIYQKIREFHCARKEEPHECSGRMTIDRNGLTLQCPRCGDSRQRNATKEESDAAMRELNSRRSESETDDWNALKAGEIGNIEYAERRGLDTSYFDEPTSVSERGENNGR